VTMAYDPWRSFENYVSSSGWQRMNKSCTRPTILLDMVFFFAASYWASKLPSMLLELISFLFLLASLMSGRWINLTDHVFVRFLMQYPKDQVHSITLLY
jgi:hypothetical protein